MFGNLGAFVNGNPMATYVTLPGAGSAAHGAWVARAFEHVAATPAKVSTPRTRRPRS